MNSYFYYPFDNFYMDPSNRASMNIDLFGPYEGFIKGNMFKNLYQPYKNYEPSNMVITNEREELLLNLNQVEFASHDINLYLDNYPNDTNMINKFNTLRKQYDVLLKQYESKYGPLFVRSSVDSKTPWQWDNEPWPWERSAN